METFDNLTVEQIAEFDEASREQFINQLPRDQRVPCILKVAEYLEEAEPDLFMDEQVGPYAPSDTNDKALDQIIALQERMAKGMKLINECTKKLEYFKAGYYVRREVFMSWVERRKKLWEHWFFLKNECQAFIGTKSYLWGFYFNLLKEDLNPYWIGERDDIEEFDSQLVQKGKEGAMQRTDWDVYAEQHCRENREFQMWQKRNDILVEDYRLRKQSAQKAPQEISKVVEEHLAYQEQLLAYVAETY